MNSCEAQFLKGEIQNIYVSHGNRISSIEASLDMLKNMLFLGKIIDGDKYKHTEKLELEIKKLNSLLK